MNLKIWETNNLVKELRKCSTLFALHNLWFWRRTKTDIFQRWCLDTGYYEQTLLIQYSKLNWFNSARGRVSFFHAVSKIMPSCFGDLKSASLSENNLLDVEEEFWLMCSLLLPCGWKRTNSKWSYRFKTLLPQLPFLFFPKYTVVILSERDTFHRCSGS